MLPADLRRSPATCTMPGLCRLTLGVAAALVPLTGLAAPPTAAVAAVDLDRVVVEGERESEYAAGESTSGTGLALTPRETPQSVSVVGRAQMDDFGLDTINEALDATTGINVERVETGRTYYTARGFDITNFQRDGLGIPLPYGIQNGDVDTAMFERIEVLRGANGLMSGTGNPSATINFVRKRPTAALDGGVRATAGSRDRRRVEGDVSGPLAAGGAIRGRVVGAWEQGDSHLDRHALEKYLVYGVVEADLGEATVLTVGASRQRNRADSPLWGALPLYYSDGSPTDYDRGTSTAADWAYWITDDTRGFAELARAFAGGWELKAAYNWHEAIEDTQLFYVYGTPDRDTGLGLFAYPSDYEGEFVSRNADLRASGPFVLGGRGHELVVGASWAQGRMHEVSWFGNDIGTPLPALEEFDGRYPKPAFDAFSDGSDFDFRRDSLYATARWNLADGFKLITGANHARVRSAGFGYGEPRAAEASSTSPFVGAVWDFAPAYSLYASYAEIFSPQSKLDLAGDIIAPIEGSNAELGIKGEWFEGRLDASVAAFRVEQDNLAEYAGYDFDSGRYYYVPTDARSTGVELDLAGSIGEHWSLAGGFTHQQIEDPEGNDARTYVPRNLLRLSTVYHVPQLRGLRLGASVRWQDDIHRDQGTTADGSQIVTRQDAYAVVGLMAGYRSAGGWEATLNLDNLTDEKYIPSLYWSQGFYAPPRNASLTVGYRF
jgi:outer-membrane receptor for ferric coprogen and ferric-rhodotorulic acid